MMRTFMLMLVLLTGVATVSQAQRSSRKKPAFAGDNPFNRPQNDFLDTQWWLGLKGGVVLTQPNLWESQHVFAPIDYGASRNASTYDEYNTGGLLLGIDITFYHKGFSVGVQPNYQRPRYTQQTNLNWQGDTESEQLTLTYDHQNTVEYLELPLFVKYDILGKRVRPFVMAGGYYGYRMNAEKVLAESGIDRASGSATDLNGETLSLKIGDLYNRHNYGVLGGLGISFDFWNIRTVLDVTYRYGLANVANEQTRYSNNQLVGLGEVMDDLSLNNVVCSFMVDFPLRFISKEYAPF